MPLPKKRTARTANDKIKSRLKKGTSKRALSPSGTGMTTRFKTKQGLKQASSGIRKAIVPRASSSAPEGNRKAKRPAKASASTTRKRK